MIVSRGPGSFDSKMAWKSDPGPLSFVLVTTSVLAPGVMVVSANAALFAGFGSAVVPVTPALLGSVAAGARPDHHCDRRRRAAESGAERARQARAIDGATAGATDARRDPRIEPHEKSSCTPVAVFGPLFVTAML